MLKKGSIIAIIRVHIIQPTQTITRGSIAVCIFFTISSISLFAFILYLSNKFERFQVSSHIFTTLASSIGNNKFSFQL